MTAVGDRPDLSEDNYCRSYQLLYRFFRKAALRPYSCHWGHKRVAVVLHSYNRYTRLNNRYRIPGSQSSRSRCRIMRRYVCLRSNRKSCRFLLDLRRYNRILNNQWAAACICWFQRRRP